MLDHFGLSENEPTEPIKESTPKPIWPSCVNELKKDSKTKKFIKCINNEASLGRYDKCMKKASNEVKELIEPCREKMIIYYGIDAAEEEEQDIETETQEETSEDSEEEPKVWPKCVSKMKKDTLTKKFVKCINNEFGLSTYDNCMKKASDEAKNALEGCRQEMIAYYGLEVEPEVEAEVTTVTNAPTTLQEEEEAIETTTEEVSEPERDCGKWPCCLEDLKDNSELNGSVYCLQWSDQLTNYDECMKWANYQVKIAYEPCYPVMMAYYSLNLEDYPRAPTCPTELQAAGHSAYTYCLIDVSHLTNYETCLDSVPYSSKVAMHECMLEMTEYFGIEANEDLLPYDRVYYQDYIPHADNPGSSCDAVSIMGYRDSCLEGNIIDHDSYCTPRCDSGVPTFAQLICLDGLLHPPGLLSFSSWSEEDAAMGLKFLCEEPDSIPKPGLKRGMSIWNHPAQEKFYMVFNTDNTEESPATIGWWYNWGFRPNEWAFSSLESQRALAASTFFPMWSWNETSYRYDYPYESPFYLKYNEDLVAAEPYFGSFNEPYRPDQADLTPDEVLELWPNFEAKLEELANALGMSSQEIKLVGPSIGPDMHARTWGEDFYSKAEKLGLRIDIINMHSYKTAGGCNCLVDQFRDEFSVLRYKFGKPMWLTEFNCGNGFHKCDESAHKKFMTDMLPMLETHPFISRYNWFSAISGDFNGDLWHASLVDPDYEFTEIGDIYNEFTMPKGATHDNPQWANIQEWTGRWREPMHLEEVRDCGDWPCCLVDLEEAGKTSHIYCLKWSDQLPGYDNCMKWAPLETKQAYEPCYLPMLDHYGLNPEDYDHVPVVVEESATEPMSTTNPTTMVTHDPPFETTRPTTVPEVHEMDTTENSEIIECQSPDLEFEKCALKLKKQDLYKIAASCIDNKYWLQRYDNCIKKNDIGEDITSATEFQECKTKMEDYYHEKSLPVCEVETTTASTTAPVTEPEKPKESYKDYYMPNPPVNPEAGCEPYYTLNYDIDGEAPCVEGWYINHNEYCTPRCPDGLSPPYAKLICLDGQIHPPGLIKKAYWSPQDFEQGLIFTCQAPDPIPAPGIKRGMSIWSHGKQENFYQAFNNYGPEATVGWWYTWAHRPNEWAFKSEESQEALKNSTYFPMWAWLEDGDVPFQLNHNQDIVAAEPYYGFFNEPYGKEQANMSPQGVVDLWPKFVARAEELAGLLGLAPEEIKIVSPSVGPKKEARLWGEEFFALAKEANLRIDIVNIHSYTTNGGCKCDYQLLRDELSQLRFKWNLPIWLTEFNCANGYWGCPYEDHAGFMSDALPMLDSHPWVPRYNWMSALASNNAIEASLMEKENFTLLDLGEYYNNYVWDGENPSQNPHWNHKPVWTGRWRENDEL